MELADRTTRLGRMFSTFWRAFIGTVQLLAVMALVVIIVITFTNIVRRSLGVQSYLWVEETARVLLMWLTFLGGTLATARSTHLVLDFLADRGSPITRRVISVLVVLASLAFFALLAYEGWKYSVDTSRRVLPSLEISAGWMVNSAVAGGVLFTIALAGRLFQQYLEPHNAVPETDPSATAPSGVED